MFALSLRDMAGLLDELEAAPMSPTARLSARVGSNSHVLYTHLRVVAAQQGSKDMQLLEPVEPQSFRRDESAVGNRGM